eukprot:ANDGO_01708.mRNA.1 Retrovirus-related Pol polyprotein from transposon 412
MEKLVAPFLEKVDSASWGKFTSDFETYTARGGDRKVRVLISAASLKIIELLGVDMSTKSDEEFITAVSSNFAPVSVLESLDRFQRISMTNKVFTKDALLNFIISYEKEEVACAKHLPDDKKLRKLFVASLKPSRLSQRVDVREPKDLREAKRFALQEADILTQMMSEVALTNGVSNASKEMSPVETKTSYKPRMDVTMIQPRQVADSAGASIVCHGCGKAGHVRSACPNKQSHSTGKPSTAPTKQWQRNPGQRLERNNEAGPRGNENVGTLKSIRDEGQSNRPHIHVVLKGLFGDIQVKALLDSGASDNFVSQQVFERLQKLGVGVSAVNKHVEIADRGIKKLDTLVQSKVMITKEFGVTRDFSSDISLYVMETGEDVIIGYPFLDNAGLTTLLVRSEHIEVRDESHLDTEPVFPDDKEGNDGFPWIRVFSGSAKLEALIKEYEDIFENDLSPVPARVVPMKIDLVPGMTPKAVPPRRQSPAVREIINSEVEAMLEQRIIKPSNSAYSSPPVVVRKPGKKPRICIDFREINKCTVPLQYPMNHTAALLERMAGKKLFAKLDMKSGFNQMPLDDESMKYTAFSTEKGLFEYTRVPFGLRNAPPYFQRVMNETLAGLVENTCEVFVDDICVGAKDVTELVERLRAVFDRMRQFGLRLNPAKCQFGLEEVEYVGHLVNGQGIRLTSARVQGIADIQVPRNVAKLRSFMGMANYFRAFVPNFATVAKPLTALQSDKAKFVWTDECQSAFDRIKAAALNAPMLHHLQYDQEIYLRTDASTEGIGGMLYQKDGDVEMPIAYLSQKFTGAETPTTWLDTISFLKPTTAIWFTSNKPLLRS